MSPSAHEVESDLHNYIGEACNKYLLQKSWEPHLLQHVAGYIYCTLQDTDIGEAVTDVSLNLGIRGLVVIVRCKAVSGPEVPFVFDVTYEGKSYKVRRTT